MEHHPFHVPQQSRRHKLRFIPLPLPQNDTVSSHHHQQQQLTSPVPSALNLSLSTHARGSGSNYSSATPVGPFTGYSSILARSRFLRPAQELLEGLSVGRLTDTDTETEPALVTKKILEESGSWFYDDDENENVFQNCTNPNLLSMLHQMETMTGAVTPAIFDETTRCPDELVRRIRLSASFEDPRWRGKLLDTYDTETDQFIIAPSSWSLCKVQMATYLQQLPDSEILQTCSTSPYAEAPDFWDYLIKHSNWKDVFRKGQPRVFKRDANGQWVMIEQGEDLLR